MYRTCSVGTYLLDFTRRIPSRCCLCRSGSRTESQEGEVSNMELANFRIVTTEFRTCCLGDYIHTTLLKRVDDGYDILYKVARRWSVDFAVQKFLNLMVLINPRLSCRLQAHLKPLVTRALDQLLWQRDLDPQVMRALVALACPNQETALLLGYLVEIIVGLVRNDPAFVTDSKANTDAASCTLREKTNVQLSQEKTNVQLSQEKTNVAQCLYHHYCIDQIYVAAMPSPVRKAVLAALMLTGSSDASSQGTQHSTPICCITLEPLLSPDGMISPDVVAVIQRSSVLCKSHAFLYRGRALFEWLSASAVPKSPETRTIVLPTDIYRLS